MLRISLGRTGVLISCYLVYSLRVSANDAIRYVRIKRPGSVQTRRQILCVRNFAQFILPQMITYFLKDNVIKDKYMKEFTLKRFLMRQKIVHHGYEERYFRYIPKIVHCLCERILKLSGCWINEFLPSNIPLTLDFLCTKFTSNMQRYESTFSLSSSNSDYFKSIKSSTEDISTPVSPNSSDSSDNRDASDLFSEISTLDGNEITEELLIENKCFQDLEKLKDLYEEIADETIIIQDLNITINALLTDYQTLDNDTKKKIRKYQNDINFSQLGWAQLNVETDLKILTNLLFEWIEGLKTPIIKNNNFENIVVLYKKPEICLSKFAIEDAYLVEYLLRFVSKIQPISEDNQDNILKRIIAALSKQSIIINNKLIPSDKDFRKFREGTLACTRKFFASLLDLIETNLRTNDYLDEQNKI